MKLTNNQVVAVVCDVVAVVSVCAGAGFVAVIALIVLFYLWDHTATK